MLSENQKFRILSILLISAVLVQGGLLLRQVAPEILAIRGTIGQTGLWRSANFYQNLRFANYVYFLNEHIPEDAWVVLSPVKSGPKILGITPFMQFFLAPRRVVNCPDEDCLDGLSGDNMYVVITDSVLASRVAESHEQVLMFDEGWGVVMPEDITSEKPDPASGFGSLFEVIWSAVWPAVWLFLLTIAGTLFVQRLIVPHWGALVKFALGYGLALGVFSLTAATASFAGIPLRRDTLCWMTSILFVGALVFFCVDRRYGQTGESADRLALSKTMQLDPWQAAFLVLGVIAFLISVGKGYHSTDAILLWGAKGYGIAATGTITDITAWGTNTVPYPLNVPILIGSLKILFTDILPASKMIFSGYYVGLMLVMYHALLRLGTRQSVAGLATLLMGTTPIVFRHATIGYANLALSFYLISAVFVLVQSLEDPGGRRAGRVALLSGLLFTTAAWSRPEGLVLSWLIIALIFGIVYIKRRGSFSLRQLGYVGSPLVIYGLFWLLIKNQVYAQRVGKTDLAAIASRGILSGNLHLDQVCFILRSSLVHLLRFDTWGLLGVALVIVLLAFVIALARRRVSTSLILWSGALIVLVIFGVYYLASYDTVHDISWWVNTGLDRMYLPGVILLWIGGISSIKLFDNDE